MVYSCCPLGGHWSFDISDAASAVVILMGNDIPQDVTNLSGAAVVFDNLKCIASWRRPVSVVAAYGCLLYRVDSIPRRVVIAVCGLA